MDQEKPAKHITHWSGLGKPSSKDIDDALIACLTLVAPTSMLPDDRLAWITVARRVIAQMDLTTDQLKAAATKAMGAAKFPSEIIPLFHESIAEPRRKYISDTGYVYRGEERQVMLEAERRADWGTYWAAKAAMLKEDGAKDAPRLEGPQAFGQIAKRIQSEQG